MNKTIKKLTIGFLAIAVMLCMGGVAKAVTTIGVNSMTNDGVLTLTAAAGSTWSTSAGVLAITGDEGVTITGTDTGDINITATATSINISADEAAADQIKLSAAGTINGDAINLVTTDGGIILTAAGASYGDIQMTSADDTTIDPTGILTLTAGEASIWSTADAKLTIEAGTSSGAELNLISDLSHATAINIDATAGGIDIDISSGADDEDFNVTVAGTDGDIVLLSGDDLDFTATDDASIVTTDGAFVITAGGATQDLTITVGNDFIVVGSAADSAITLGTGITSGAISIGGAKTSGDITLGKSTKQLKLATATGAVTVDAGGLTITAGNALLSSGTLTVTSDNAKALAVGRQGATDPAFQVDANTGTSVTGLKVTAGASGGGFAVAVVGGAANENLTIDARGSGTISLNATGTGGIVLARAVTVLGGIDTTGGVTLVLGASAASKVEIADTGIITDVEGPLVAKEDIKSDEIDSESAAAMLIGKATATSVEIADAGVTTDIQGPVTVLGGIDTAGAATLILGEATATAVEISVSGIMTTVEGTLNVDEAVTIDTSLGVGGGTAITEILVGSLADDASGWTPDGAADVDFTITVSAASIEADSHITVSVGNNATPVACGVYDKNAGADFRVRCEAVPANAATLEYMIVNF